MSVSQELSERPHWAYLQCAREYTEFDRRDVHLLKYVIKISLDKHLTTTIKRIRLVIVTFEDVEDLVWHAPFLQSEIGRNRLAPDSKAEELQIHLRFEHERNYYSSIINGSLSLCNRASLTRSPPTYTRILHNKVYALSASNPIIRIPFDSALSTILANGFPRQSYPNPSSINHYFIHIAKAHGFFDSTHWFPALPVNVIANIARYCLLLNKPKSLWDDDTLRSELETITNLSLISKQWTQKDVLKDVLLSRIMSVSAQRLYREGLSLAVRLLRERPFRGRGLRGIMIPTSYQIRDPEIDGGESREKLLEELRELHGYLADLDWVDVTHPGFAAARKELAKLKNVDRFYLTRGDPVGWWEANTCIIEEVLETINGWELLRSVMLEGKNGYTVGDPTKVPSELPAYCPQYLTLHRLPISDVQIRHIVSNPIQQLESLTLNGVIGLTSRGLREVLQLIAGCLRNLSIRTCRISSERDETLGNNTEEFQERPLDSTISLMPTILDVDVQYEVASNLSIARKLQEEPGSIHRRKARIKITNYKIPDRKQSTYSEGEIGLTEALLKTGWKEVVLCFWNGGNVLDQKERRFRKRFVQLARNAANRGGVVFRAP